MIVVADGDALGTGVVVGLEPGSSEGVTGSLGDGVRSGPPGSLDPVGTGVGTDPRPPEGPAHAAMVATSSPAMRIDEMRFMAGSPGRLG
jgi:hypothetical protein